MAPSPPPVADPAQIGAVFDDDVLPALCSYVKIPCLSPAFDPEWESAGHLRAAAGDLAQWCATRPVHGLTDGTVEVLGAPGRTPLLVVDLPAIGAVEGTVLLYGHLDKQPPLGTWSEGLGPFEPVRRGDLLYGRGTADDGYAVFAALTALEVLGAAPRPRVVVLIEASEESGSPDLGAPLAELGPRLGRPDLVVCLDSGCLSYDRLWRTTSLRGCLIVTLRVDVLDAGVHSGLAGGVVPSSFRLLRRLLSRIEDERTGDLLLPELRAEVPPGPLAEARAVAAEVPDAAARDLPVVAGLSLGGSDPADRLLARSWRASLSVTGIDGVPAIADGGNVLRPFTAAKLSIRTPPNVDADAAALAVEAALGADPPEGARVAVKVEAAAPGWVAPDPARWVEDALDRASHAAFGRPAAAYGEGGTIPFLSVLGSRFPDAQMVALGVLGPGSNAHGPDECLHLPTAEAVSLAVAELVAAAADRAPGGRR